MGIATLTELFARFESFGDAPALVAFAPDGREMLTFAQLCQRSRSLAGGLRDHGVARGEPVALFAPNSVDWVLCRLALLLLDAPCVPIDDGVDAEQLRHIVAHSGAGRIVTHPKNLPLVRQAQSGAARDLELILIGRADEEGAGLLQLDTLAGEPLAEPAPAEPDGRVSRFYTSGTTGLPKAVPLSHRNVATNLDALLELDLVGPGDRVLLPLPLHHSYPFIVGLLLPLYAGAAVIFPAGLSGPLLAQALKEGGITVLVGVPRLYEALVAAIDAQIGRRGAVASAAVRGLMALSATVRRRFGLRWGRRLLAPLHRQVAPTLRLIVSGGARLGAAVGWRLEALGYQVLEGYGLVETTSVATFNKPEAHRIGSPGKPSRAVEMRIVPVEEMEHGEIQFRGPIVFSGYADNPDANANAFTDDGWFRTGDLGWQDADGFLHIAGRIKEMIVTPGGKNISPEHVEGIYAQSPFVKEVAVLEHGDGLAAVVLPDFEALRGSSSTGDAATQIRVSFGELGQQLPAWMRIGGFVLTRESLPRNPIGKMRRHMLPDIYARAERGERGPPAALSQEDETLLATEPARQVLGWLDRRYPDADIGPDTLLQMELGVDSLDWVGLSLEIRDRLGVTLSEDAIAELVTVRDLIEAVAAAEPAGAVPRENRRGVLAEDPQRWLEAPGVMAHAAGAVLYGIAWLIARGFFRLRIEGQERVPRDGPLIVIANHESDLDPLIVAAALPYATLRRTWWSGIGRRVFGNAAGRALARIAQIFPVDERAPSASLDLAAEVVGRGRILVWFPEEWRSPDGTLQAFRPGIGALVVRTQAAILPCWIDGTFEAMPRTVRLPKPHPVRVRFGDAVPASDLVPDPAPADAREAHIAIAAKARDRLAALIGQP